MNDGTFWLNLFLKALMAQYEAQLAEAGAVPLPEGDGDDDWWFSEFSKFTTYHCVEALLI